MREFAERNPGFADRIPRQTRVDDDGYEDMATGLAYYAVRRNKRDLGVYPFY